MNWIQQLSYLVIESERLADWDRYATDFMGMRTRLDGDRLKIRMDDFSYRFIVQQGPAEDLCALGLLVNDLAALQALEAHLVGMGIEVQHATPDELAQREVAAMIWVRDPEGLRIEITCGATICTQPIDTPLVAGGFVTGDKGFGHVALCASDLAACEKFYMKALGFRLTDYIVQEIQGIPIHFTFMHVNPRHHSVALAGLPSPTRLNHMEVQVQDMDVIGRAMRRAKDLDIDLYMNLGRHPNDRMLSFYANTPSNFALEIGGCGLQIDDESTWQVRTYDAISEWGHLD